LRLAQRRFGKIGKRKESQIRKLSIEKLDALFDALLDMQSEKELNEWLRKNVTATVH
jgi:ribosomal protein L15